MNNLRGNYVRYKLAQGCTFAHVGKSLERSVDGYAALRSGGHLADEELLSRIMEASVLPRQEYEKVRQALEAGDVLDEALRWSYERTRLELFYRADASPDLVRLDRRGAFRHELRLFERVSRLPPEGVPEDAAEPIHKELSFLAVDHDLAPTLVRLLRLTPIWRTHHHDGERAEAIEAARGRLVPHPDTMRLAREGRVAGSFDAEAVFDARDLQLLVRFMLGSKGPLENVLGHEVRADILTNPVQQLGLIVGKIGLGLTRVGSLKISGRKIRRYRLDGSTLATMQEIADRRERKGGWAFLVDRYGPHMDPADQDDWTEVDAQIERATDFVRGHRGTSQEEGEE
jgi:hypothetical protein